jgi:hypothetical protein
MNIRIIKGDSETWYRDHRIGRFDASREEYWEEVVDHVIRGGVRVKVIETEDYWDAMEWD